MIPDDVFVVEKIGNWYTLVARGMLGSSVVIYAGSNLDIFELEVKVLADRLNTIYFLGYVPEADFDRELAIESMVELRNALDVAIARLTKEDVK